MATDNLGMTYVTDVFSNSIVKFDANGNFVERIESVSSPVSVAVNPEGQLFIGDGNTGYIYACDEGGEATEFFIGTRFPGSMEFSREGILYVSDSKLRQVLAIDLSGNLLDSIGSGILDLPTGIAVDNNRQRILVGEHGGSGTGFKPIVKVWMFDMDGNLLNSFGSHGNGDGMFYRVQDLVVGRCGNIFVVDPFLGRISIFNSEGTYITKFGDFGVLPGQLNVPMDIVYDAQERLIISSMNNGTLEFFAISDSLPSSRVLNRYEMICSGDSALFEIAFTGTAPWTFTYTVDGLQPTTVTTFKNPHQMYVSDEGHYEVVALSDALYEGTCFTGSVYINMTEELPTSLISGDTVICAGENAVLPVTFTGSPPWEFSYTRDGENPLSILTVNNPELISTELPGRYEVTSIIGGGCSGSLMNGNAEVLVKPLPTATIMEGNATILVDSGESAELTVSLTGTPPWALTYMVDDLNPVSISEITGNPYRLTSSMQGTHEIKLVSDGWCINDLSDGYPEIVLKGAVVPPTAELVEGEFSICPGEFVPLEIAFTGTAPWTFTYRTDTLMTTTIFNAYTNPYIINAIYGGIYEVIALADAYSPGTELTGQALVSLQPVPVPGFGYATDMLDVSFQNISTGADSYSWDFGDGNVSLETDPVHTYVNEGSYVVTLEASEQTCGTVQSIVDTVVVSSSSVVNAGSAGLWNIYPNPSGGLVTFEMENHSGSSMTMEIVSMNGRVVYSNEFHGKNVLERLDLVNFPEGVYLVRVVTGEFTGIKKLILNRR